MRKKRYWLAVLLILAGICLIGCSKGKNQGKTEGGSNTAESLDKNKIAYGKQDVIFSKSGYFYSNNIKVEIISKKPCKIYYTTDGSEPDRKKKLYNKAISLTANKETKADCIKAKAYFNDGTKSDTIVHTYFVGKDVKERFDTLIFSISTDPDNLYDYKRGIFVEGKLRTDYLKKHPNVKVTPDLPANFNMRGKKSEREVYMEIFKPDGTRVDSQVAGIRTYGAWSRANRQKSIKIFARKEYDNDNKKIKYEFFPDRKKVDGKPIDSFKKLVLRDSGNDNGFAFIRDELFQTLARQAVYQDYEAVRPAALFINGKYNGFYWIHEVYDDDYFEDNYGKYDGNFQVLEGGENFKDKDEEDDNSAAIKDYSDMYSYAKKDLTDDANYKKLCKLMDVENYLSYYALEVYIDNDDWPHNNYKTYRYYAADGKQYAKAPFDGKWRYLLHDLDFSFGIYGEDAYADNIKNFVGKNGEMKKKSPLFSQLMRRDDCREIFIRKTLDLMNGAFAPDNVSKVLDEMNTTRINELKHMYGKELMEDWVSADQLPQKIQVIKTYSHVRAAYILRDYKKYFKMGDVYKLYVEPAGGCSVKINSITTDKNFNGSYYTKCDTKISACIPEGKKFDYWLFNGKKITEEELTITESMASNEVVEVKLMLK